MVIWNQAWHYKDESVVQYHAKQLWYVVRRNLFSITIVRRTASFATSYLVGREDKRTDNRTKLSSPKKNNAAAVYKGLVKLELLKGAGQL